MEDQVKMPHTGLLSPWKSEMFFSSQLLLKMIHMLTLLGDIRINAGDFEDGLNDLYFPKRVSGPSGSVVDP
jgi:hypothetical protein